MFQGNLVTGVAVPNAIFFPVGTILSRQVALLLIPGYESGTLDGVESRPGEFEVA